MPHVWLRVSLFTILLLLAGCGQFKQYKVLESPEGIYATLGLSPDGDGVTICLAERPLEICPRSEAIFYRYRSRDGDEWWQDNVLMITQVGGEVRTRPPEGPIRVGDHEVFVRLEFTP